MFFSRLFRLFGKDFAMDLGTANTLIYCSKRGIVLNEPSVVAIDERENKVLAVGAEAKICMGRQPKGIRIVRPLKDGVIADFEVTSRMISYFIKKVTNGIGLAKPSMVIGIPPYVTNVEKRAVIDSAHDVGVQEVKLVDEAMASAVSAKLPVNDAYGNMVVDIGGGTCDVAVISMSGLVCGETLRVAGDELTESIQEYIKNTHRLLISENAAERIKIDVGSAAPQTQALTTTVAGRGAASGMPESITVNDKEILQAMKTPVREIFQAVKRTLEKTPPQLIDDIATQGILLVGGGALIRGMGQAIANETKIRVNVDHEPLTACVRGAGIIVDDRKTFSKVFIS